MAEDHLDIFKFGRSGKPKLGANRKAGPRIPPLPRPGRNSPSSSDSSDDEEEGRPRRRPRHGTKKGSMAASRLLKQSNKDNSSSNDSDDVEVLSASKRLKPSTAEGSQTPSRSPSPPRHAISLPSPPPPGVGIIGAHSNDNSRQVLNEANDVLNRILYTTPLESSLSEYHSDLIDLASFTPPPLIQNMNLRIRYKGKVRKYPVNKSDAFSNVITMLAKELEGTSDDKILLTHKTTTIKPTDSPASLGLTTADIIDAVIMTESALVECEESRSAADTITIKVQTSEESMKYSLASSDPLRKVMVAFATKLNTSLKNLKFVFDGSVVDEDQTPQDLDMEDGDCIDVQ